MGTVVLRSQDCLRNQFHYETLPCPSLKQGRKNPSRIHRSGGRRKRSPPSDSSDSDRSTTKMVAKFPVKKLVMGEVKILKRGEPIVDSKVTKAKSEEKSELGKGDTDVFSKSRIGPEPGMIPKEIRLPDLRSDAGVENFAGCGFVASPSPSSLPIPVFLPQVSSTKSVLLPKVAEDLRRMLNLS